MSLCHYKETSLNIESNLTSGMGLHLLSALSLPPWGWYTHGSGVSLRGGTVCRHTHHTCDSRYGWCPGAPGTSRKKYPPPEQSGCDSGRPEIPGGDAGALNTSKRRTPDRSWWQADIRRWGSSGTAPDGRFCSLTWRSCPNQRGILK